MARKKTRKPKLAKLFDGSDQVIAIVDQDFEVLYANEACCHWLGLAEKELLSNSLIYSSAEIGTKSANGICPPPSLFENDQAPTDPTPKHFTACIFSDANQNRVWQRASFTRIDDPSFPLQSVLVIGSGSDLTSQPADSPAAQPAELHAVLSAIGQQDQEKYSLANWIGNSAYTTKIRRQLEAVSANDSDCLIVGPPGSGKEHLARTIFQRRYPRSADLIPVHCSIADGQLIQNSIKEWVFDQREKQTSDWLLLLDIDQLGAEAQAELLGYTKLPNFQLRILATAEKDLESLGRAGDFSLELANYLAVQIIGVQPLRNRTADIPLLTQFFIERNNRGARLQVQGCSDEVLEAFHEYHWPRNLEELDQTITAAQATTKNRIIQLDDLPSVFHHGLSAIRIGKFEPTKIQLDDYLSEIEKELIHRALKQSQNNKSKAADLLGINRAKLLRRATALKLIDQPTKTDGNTVDESAFTEADPDQP